jgi:hypothetical protein
VLPKPDKLIRYRHNLSLFGGAVRLAAEDRPEHAWQIESRCVRFGVAGGIAALGRDD